MGVVVDFNQVLGNVTFRDRFEISLERIPNVMQGKTPVIIQNEFNIRTQVAHNPKLSVDVTSDVVNNLLYKTYINNASYTDFTMEVLDTAKEEYNNWVNEWLRNFHTPEGYARYLGNLTATIKITSKDSGNFIIVEVLPIGTNPLLRDRGNLEVQITEIIFKVITVTHFKSDGTQKDTSLALFLDSIKDNAEQALF